MAHQMIRVPEEHAAEFRRALLRAHTRCTDLLADELTRYRSRPDRLEALEGALVELRDVHDAVDQIGWAHIVRRGGIAVSLHPEVLDDAIRAMVGSAAPPPRWLAEQLRGDQD